MNRLERKEKIFLELIFRAFVVYIRKNLRKISKIVAKYLEFVDVMR